MNPDVDSGDMDGFLRLLLPEAFMACLDFQDSLLHWVASPVSRLLIGFHRLASGLLGTYLFPPFGPQPSPGWNDKCAKEVRRIARRMRPPSTRWILRKACV